MATPARRLSRQRMIEGMLASDADDDGRFVTGVLSTGIYCLPSCRAKKPRPENVRFFDRPEAAEAAGLRPCKRCKPLLFYRDQDPDRALVEGLVERLRADPSAVRNVAGLVRSSGVGSSKLAELFRRHYHATPSQMLHGRRIELACRRLLADGDDPASGRPRVADVAFEVGFESLSAFNDHFRRRCRMSPRAYRALRCGDRFELSLPSWFLAGRVLAYLGRDPRSLTEEVAGQNVRLGLRAGGRPLLAEVELLPGRARCRISSPRPLAAGAARAAHRQLLRLLGLVIDPRPFERRIARREEHRRLVAGKLGLSIPQTGSCFDGLVWVIAGQQVSLPVAFALRRRLAERAGVRLDGLYAPPTAAAVADLDAADLRAMGFSRRKVEYLLGVAGQVAAGELDLDRLAQRSVSRIEATLQAVRGLGPWSVQYLMMRSFALADCVPVGDVALERNLKRYYGLDRRPDKRRTLELMATFAPYRSLATFHLWALQQESQ